MSQQVNCCGSRTQTVDVTEDEQVGWDDIKRCTMSSWTPLQLLWQVLVQCVQCFYIWESYITPNIVEEMWSLLRNHLFPPFHPKLTFKQKFSGWFESQSRTISRSLASVCLIDRSLKTLLTPAGCFCLQTQPAKKSPQSTSYTHTHMHINQTTSIQCLAPSDCGPC